jgi:3-oxoacyl-[acyl-carrier protein] reductase
VDGHGEAPVAEHLRGILGEWGVQVAARASTSVAGVILDMTEVAGPDDLETVRAVVGPALKTLAPTGRVVLVGRPPEDTGEVAQAAARQALEGIMRSVAKEMRGGGTANLVLLSEGADDNVDSTVRFLLSGRSAYVSGQVVRVGRARPAAPPSWESPLAGKVAVVTGAARGIGRSIAETLARDGATLVCVDVPAAGGPLSEVANAVGGTALQVDVTAEDAGRRILEHARTRHGGLDVVVHNAGITRDKLLANTDEDRWRSVLEVNLMAILRMNETLLSRDGLRDGGHVVCVSSVTGIAGNRGQANYAASKAGIIGLVEALGRDEVLRERGITVNAVAPGFIETEMTTKIPLATREVGRRLNSLAQGGLPVDVAETIGWLSWDATAGVTGNVVRVCGQMQMGA